MTENQKRLAQKRLTMYYDGSCSLCRTEAHCLRSHCPDKVTTVPVDEALEELNALGISRVDAMTYVYVKDGDGKMHCAMDAVRLLQQATQRRFLGMPIERWLSLPLIKPFLDWLYPIIARNRYRIPNRLTRLVYGRVIASDSPNKVTETEDNTSNCTSGVCHIPPSERP